jgi:hypothetical protein
MQNIKLISHNTIDGLNGIKTAALFFDKIEIPDYSKLKIQGILNHSTNKLINPLLKTNTYYKDECFHSHLQPLIDAKIVSLYLEFLKDEDLQYDPITTKVTFKLSDDDSLNDAVEENMHYIFKMKKIEKGTDTISLKNLYRKEVPQFIASKEKSELDAVRYYIQLVKLILDNTSNGQQCMTTSIAVNNILHSYYNSTKFKDVYRKISREVEINPSLIFDTLNLSVPNLSKLSFEDVLEVRSRLSDELTAFKVYMKNFQLDLLQTYDDKFISLKSNELVKLKIMPALDDLKRKLEGLNVNIPVKILQEVKDPKSYSPLLLTFSNNFATSYAVLVSLGIISLSTALEYTTNKKEIKSNGLYYLLKLNQ